MIFLKLTSSQTRKTIYVNADHIVRIDDYNNVTRLMTVATSSDTDSRHSPKNIYVTEAASVVADMIADGGAALMEAGAEEP